MKTEDILAVPPKVLSPAQRAFYFENGYLLVERAVGNALLERIRRATAEMVEKSRELTRSDARFDLEPGPFARNAAAASAVEPGRPSPGVLAIRQPIGDAPTSSPIWSGPTSNSIIRS